MDGNGSFVFLTDLDLGATTTDVQLTFASRALEVDSEVLYDSSLPMSTNLRRVSDNSSRETKINVSYRCVGWWLDARS